LDDLRAFVGEARHIVYAGVEGSSQAAKTAEAETEMEMEMEMEKKEG
jgi:hypothetical protein